MAHAREFANDARKVLAVGRIPVIKSRATEQAALTKMIFRVERRLSRIAEALDRSLATEQTALTKMIFRIERRLNRMAEALDRVQTSMKAEARARKKSKKSACTMNSMSRVKNDRTDRVRL